MITNDLISRDELLETIRSVVRCKDCKYFKACEEIPGGSWTGFCISGSFHTDEDDFCSRGVKKSCTGASDSCTGVSGV